MPHAAPESSTPASPHIERLAAFHQFLTDPHEATVATIENHAHSLLDEALSVPKVRPLIERLVRDRDLKPLSAPQAYVDRRELALGACCWLAVSAVSALKQDERIAALQRTYTFLREPHGQDFPAESHRKTIELMQDNFRDRWTQVRGIERNLHADAALRAIAWSALYRWWLPGAPLKAAMQKKS